jgi:signal transduction histidine kinase
MHAHLLAGGTVWDGELPLQAAGGRLLLLDVSGHAADGLIQLEVRDATGREQAHLAERIAVQRRLAARTAVEFQNVHRALRTMGELLLIGAGQGRPVLDELEEVQQAAERASAIAEYLQAFSGGSAPQIRPVTLNDLVQGTLPCLRRLFGRDVEIVSDLSPDVPPVMADPAQLRHIILTLAANSRDAMSRRGTFCLQTAYQPTGTAELDRIDPLGGPYGMLAVNDSGPGFDAGGSSIPCPTSDAGGSFAG